MNKHKWRRNSFAILIALLQSTSPVFAQHVVSASDDEGMAFLSMKSGRNAEALNYLNKAIAKSPDKADLYLNRSSCYLNMKDLKKALADLNKAETLMKGKKEDPTSMTILYYNRGSIFLKLKRDQDAFREMKLAVEAFPFNAGAKLELGKLYVKFGKKDLALKSLESSRDLYVQSKSRAENIAILDKEIAKAKALK